MTTEHFTLQGARSSTISESTGRASVFLGAVSGGLIALGLVATAAKAGVAFYMFGLILLPAPLRFEAGVDLFLAIRGGENARIPDISHTTVGNSVCARGTVAPGPVLDRRIMTKWCKP